MYHLFTSFPLQFSLKEKSIPLFLLLSLLLLFIHPLEAAYIQVFQTNDTGGMAWTGNTLGLSKALNLNEPGKQGSIGAFITTDSSQQVGMFPTDPNAGTTLDYTQNGSRAVLVLPPGTTDILYAELIWAGSYVANDPNALTLVQNTSITFTTPDNIPHIVAPDAAKFQTRIDAGDATVAYYVNSQDVTALVTTGGGTYTVGGVPATTIATKNTTNCAGWTLAVVYRNSNMFTSNLVLFIGCEAQGSQNTVTGFHAPDNGPITSRIFVSALEGDAELTGDQLLVGPTPLSLNPISGTNNPVNNFFPSQINTILNFTTDPVTGALVPTGDGQLDQTGSYGTLNSNASTGTNVSGARQGYDITSIPLTTTEISNGQTALTIEGTTSEDVYTITALGLQIQVSAPFIQATKQSSSATATFGDALTFTTSFTNAGDNVATNLVFIDPLSTGLTFIPNSFFVNGVPFSITASDLNTGVPIGDLAVGATTTVVFSVTVTQVETSYDNTITLNYEFIPFIGQPPVQLQTISNTVTVTSFVTSAPVANPDFGITNANTMLNQTISVLNNDTGTNISVSSYTSFSTQIGTVVMQLGKLSDGGGAYFYSPPNNFSGIDTFQYTITDYVGRTATTTVTITVLPVAIGDTATVASNTPLNQTMSVLNNDIGTGLFVSSYTPVTSQGGSVVVQPNGTYVYLSALNYSGQDVFSYTATDAAGNTTTASVVITVLPAAVDNFGITPANTILFGSTVFTNDVGTGLILVAYDPISIHGGSVFLNPADGRYIYQPPLNFSGLDTFTYTVQDQAGNRDTATVFITVLPIANNDEATTNANTPLNQNVSVLNNDIGTNLFVIAYQVNSIQGGLVLVRPDGTYIYQPPLNFSGTDAFTYTINDGFSNATASVIITILPVAGNNTAQTLINTPLNGDSVFDNDAGSSLMIFLYDRTSAQGGSVVMNTLTGTFTYTPPLDFVGTDSFTYTIRDSIGHTSVGTVTIQVVASIPPPIVTVNPPRNFKGIIHKCKFLNRTQYQLQATWSPSSSSNIQFYRIYRRGRVVATVSANKPLTFSKCLKSKREARGYSITAVNVNGIESKPIKLRITHD